MTGNEIAAFASLLGALILAFVGARDRGTRTMLDDRASDITALRAEITKIKQDATKERERSEKDMEELRRQFEEKVTEVETLTKQMRKLRIAILNLGGDPDSILADDPPHPGQRRAEKPQN